MLSQRLAWLKTCWVGNLCHQQPAARPEKRAVSFPACQHSRPRQKRSVLKRYIALEDKLSFGFIPCAVRHAEGGIKCDAIVECPPRGRSVLKAYVTAPQSGLHSAIWSCFSTPPFKLVAQPRRGLEHCGCPFVVLKAENFVSELRMSTKGQERTKGVRDCPAEWPPSAFSIAKFSPLSEHHLYLLARQHHYSFHLFRPFMAQNVFFLANDLKSVIFEQTADIGYGMDEPPGRR